MATIDIRDVTDAEIDVIKFSDVKGNEDVCFLKKNTFVSIETAEENDWNYYIDSKEDAQNLIKALEKAIELGWWSE